MERFLHRLLLVWLLLLTSVLLAYHTGHVQLATVLLWPVALGCPLVAGALLWLAGLRLREAWRRWRVLRRARRWRH